MKSKIVGMALDEDGEIYLLDTDSSGNVDIVPKGLIQDHLLVEPVKEGQIHV